MMNMMLLPWIKEIFIFLVLTAISSTFPKAMQVILLSEVPSYERHIINCGQWPFCHSSVMARFWQNQIHADTWIVTRHLIEKEM